MHNSYRIRMLPSLTHDLCLGRRIGSAWKAPRIFFSVSHCTMLPCTSWSCAVKYRAIISIRGITDVSSFHTVSTSRKLARSTLAGWLAVGPEETSQNLSSGNNRCTGAIQSLPASFGSAHQPNTFSRVVCLNLQCYTVQIFTHNSHFSIPESLFI